ncbi:hypothetical protein TI05_00310 [Achromatium sp. WMS3]|nr:hypothetical protein TI05_00310 [Achromatium sp. WMS3]
MVELIRKAIKTLINRHATYKSRNPQIERQKLIDTEHDHYQLVTIGWHNDKRVYHCSIHLDIKDEKIWIQQNLTESDLEEELIALGIAKKDIIYGFLPPYLRAR